LFKALPYDLECQFNAPIFGIVRSPKFRVSQFALKVLD